VESVILVLTLSLRMFPGVIYLWPSLLPLQGRRSTELILGMYSHHQTETISGIFLGIQLGGASYLLLPESESHPLNRLQSPIAGCQFASLSPIKFKSAKELYSKMSEYLPVPKAKRKVTSHARASGRNEDFLPSEANKLQYFMGNSIERPQYEQNR
jgi:hypothetical protein